MSDSLTTYDKLNEDIQFTEDETRELLKLSEKEILVDCDSDALIYLVEPSGPACHTGQGTCFHNKM